MEAIPCPCPAVPQKIGHKGLGLGIEGDGHQHRDAKGHRRINGEGSGIEQKRHRPGTFSGHQGYLDPLRRKWFNATLDIINIFPAYK
jgi:hypothetical protein